MFFFVFTSVYPVNPVISMKDAAFLSYSMKLGISIIYIYKQIWTMIYSTHEQIYKTNGQRFKIKRIPLITTACQFNTLKFVSLFSTTQKVNDACGQHIYIQEQCSTFDIDKDK